MNEFQAVDVAYLAVLPMFLVAGGAIVGVLVEAFAPRRQRHGIQVWLTTGVLVLALVALLVWSWDEQTVTLGGSVAIDGVAIDDAANERGDACITQPGSRVAAWVIPTNEELMIARHTLASINTPA